MMEPTALVLVLLGSFWAGTGASMAALRFSNDVLEKVVVGKSGSQPLSLDLRQRLLRSSWLPARVMNTIVPVVVALVIVMIPSLLGQTRHFLAILCYICAAVPLLGAVAWAVFGIYEYRFAMRVIRDCKTEEEEAAVELCTTLSSSR